MYPTLHFLISDVTVVMVWCPDIWPHHTKLSPTSHQPLSLYWGAEQTNNTITPLSYQLLYQPTLAAVLQNIEMKTYLLLTDFI